MTQDVPYLKCLWHESKKAYKIYLIGLAIIGVIVGLGYVAWAIKDEIIGNITAVPLWVYAVIGIVSAPFVYAAVKCLWIRNDRKIPPIIGISTIAIGVIIVALAVISHQPEVGNDWGNLFIAIWGMGIGVFGALLLMVSE